MDERGTLSAELEAVTEERRSVCELLDSTRRSLTEVSDERNALSRRRAEALQRIQRLEVELDQSNIEIESLRESGSRQSARIEQIESERAAAETERQTLEQRLEANGAAVDRLEEQISQRDRNIVEMRGGFERDSRELRMEAERQRRHLGARLVRFRRTVAALGATLAASLLFLALALVQPGADDSRSGLTLNIGDPTERAAAAVLDADSAAKKDDTGGADLRVVAAALDAKKPEKAAPAARDEKTADAGSPQDSPKKGPALAERGGTTGKPAAAVSEGRVVAELVDTAAPAARSKPLVRIHMVKPRETLTRICRQYGLVDRHAVSRVARFNSLKNANRLKPGMILRIPPKRL